MSSTKNRMFRPPRIVLATLLACCMPWSIQAQDNALDAFLPYIGAWGPDPEGEMVKNNPDRADDFIFYLTWTDEDHQMLRFYEGVIDGDLSKRVLDTLVAANPRTGMIEFFGLQRQDNYLYKGTFEIGDNRLTRYYEVWYPEGTEFSNDEYRNRGSVRYRDQCQLLSSVTLACRTEKQLDGQWLPWGDGEPYVMVRVER